MKSKVVLLLALSFGSSFLDGQSAGATLVEEVHQFAFGKPFTFTPVYSNDASSGMSDLFFPKPGSALIGGTYQHQYFAFDTNWSSLNVIQGRYGRSFHLLSSRYAALFNVAPEGTNISVFRKDDLAKPLYEIQQVGISSVGEYDVYMTGQMIFGQGPKNDPNSLISWELSDHGKVRFRNEEETSVWLSTNGEQIGGFSYRNGYWFGPVGSPGFQLDLSYMKDTDFSSGQALGIPSLSPRDDLWFVGTDSKGLVYGYTILPWYPKRPLTGALTTKDAYCFVVIDPWQKKATFRSLSPGQHIRPEGIPVGLPQAVSSDGDIYFFDVDVPGKQFTLSRIRNNWWEELGIRSVFAGTVNDNRVRLRASPAVAGQIVGYLYENEIVRTVEATPKKDTIAGVSAPWYRIVMPDGRKGWMFGGFLDLEK